MPPCRSWLFYTYISLILLPGCYCFKPSYHENVRFPFANHDSPLCNWDGACRFNMQFHAYYGIPNTDLYEYREAYKGAAPFTYSHSTGPFGARAETFVSPFGLSRYAIMVVGVDYSHSRTALQYTSTHNNASYTNDLRFSNHRVRASVNLITLVQGYWIGYTTLQGGYNFINREVITNDPRVTYKPGKQTKFDYRAGYGIKLYINTHLAAVIEAGYGGGAYARTGLCYWVRQ